LKKNIRILCLCSAWLLLSGLAMAQSAAAPLGDGNTNGGAAVADATEPAAAPAITDETLLGFGDDAGATAVNLPSTSLVPYLLRMILVLALVLAAIYGLYALLKRRGGRTPAEDPFVRVLGSVSLSPGRFAQVVAVGSRAWLVGVGEGGISLLAELDDRELIEAMVKRAEENPQPAKADFATILAAMLPGSRGDAAKAGRGFLGRQKDRLKKF